MSAKERGTSRVPKFVIKLVSIFGKQTLCFRAIYANPCEIYIRGVCGYVY